MTDRGVSANLGLVLLLALTIVGAGVVVALGGAALQDVQRTTELTQAEHAFSELDSQISQVAIGESETRTIELGLKTNRPGQSLAVGDDGWVRLTYVNTTTGNRTTVANETLGSVTYTSGETTVAYQGGGVWRRSDGRATMVSPPEFHYRGGTLTFPVVTVDGPQRPGTDLVVRQNGTAVRRYPNESERATYRNPVPEDARVLITVRSRYYRAWGDYFEQRTDGQVNYDHDREQATIELIKPYPDVEVALTMAGGSELQMQGQSEILGYDSSVSPPTFGSNDADVVTDSDVQLQGQAEIRGDLTAAGDVDTGGNTRIYGNLSYGSGSPDCSNVDGWCAANASVGNREAIDGRVQSRINDIEASNDNDEVGAISGGTLDWSGGSEITLGAGRYYFNNSFQVAGDDSDPENLTLDTTGGDIVIAVEDTNVQFQNYANVTVKGDGTVRIYNDEQIQVQGNADVWVPGYESGRMWMYCTSNCGIQFDNDARYVGVLYAPRASNGVQIQTHADIYGGVVGGGQVQIQNDGKIHYDAALSGQAVFPDKAVLRYLYVSTNRVTVSGG